MLDPNVKSNLLKAVDLAVGPGQCRYVIDGKPACVVAQYMALNGVSVEEMGEWSSLAISDSEMGKINKFDAPLPLLGRLQTAWDKGWPTSPPPASETRAKMRNLIEEADRA